MNHMTACNLLAIACASLLVSACGGGGSSGGSDPVTTPTPVTPVTPVTTTCPALQIPDQTGACVSMYAVTPDAATCRVGTLSDATRQNALSAINQIRQLHGLDAVTYDRASDDLVMNASLMMLANGALNHNPPTTWRCYSAAGATGASTSNLAGTGASTPPEGDFILWLTDMVSLGPNVLGHRRWLLDPFLNKIAYGRADRGTSAFGGMSAVRVINDTAAPTVGATFVAYPFHDYPAKYHAQGALLSFSVVADSQNKAASADVDFSAAQISVVRRGGSAVGVSGVVFDNDWYGLPNNLRFSVGTLTYNTIHDVTISNVRVGGVLRSYSYWFRVVP
jgi:uncharacterized protein YkwD